MIYWLKFFLGVWRQEGQTVRRWLKDPDLFNIEQTGKEEALPIYTRS